MKRKKLLTLGGSICLAVALMATLITVASAAPKPIVLRFTTTHSDTSSPHVRVDKPLFKRLEEGTNGRVKVEAYTGETLVKLKDTYDAVVSGLADIALMPPTPPGRFPAIEIAGLPLSPWLRSEACSAFVMTKMCDKGYFDRDFKDVKVLFTYAPGACTLYTKKPVRSLDDFKGMKIWTHAPLPKKMVTSLGAVPRLVSFMEIYLSLDTGALDGILIADDIIESMHFVDFLRYCNRSIGYQPTHVWIMNRDKFNSLPPEVQQVIEDELSGARASEFATNALIEERKTVKAKILEVQPEFEWMELSPAEKEKVRKTAEEIWDLWIADVEAAGIPGREMLDETFRLTEEWEQLQK